MRDKNFTYIDSSGKVKMVDVGDKENSVRIVVVCVFIYLGEEVFYLVEVNKIKKGDVFFVV